MFILTLNYLAFAFQLSWGAGAFAESAALGRPAGVLELLENPEFFLATRAQLGGLLILVLCAWSVILGIRLLQRAPWARPAAVGTFAVFFLFLLASFLSDFRSLGPAVSEGPLVRFEPTGLRSPFGGVNFLLTAAVPLLLLVPLTAADFGRPGDRE